jgi:hypothetical protein
VTATLRIRQGVALVAAIVVLVVIECVIAGMVHCVMIERRVSANAELALRLRLAAASAAASAAAAWTPAIDTLTLHASVALDAGTVPIQGLSVRVAAERLHDGLYLVRASARRTAPPVARATETLLIAPPVLRLGADPAAAALTAAFVVLKSGSRVDAGNRECAAPDAAAVQLTSGEPPTIEPGAVVTGPAVLSDSATSLLRDFGRVQAAAAVAASDNVLLDTSAVLRINAAMNGVIVTAGDLILEPGAHVRGLVLVGGRLVINAGARIEGAVHALRDALIAGDVFLDACMAYEAVSSAALHRPRPFPGRPRVPVF